MNRPIVATRQLSQRVDTHAHVFSTSLPLAVERRYAPDYDAPLDAYLGLLDAHDIGNAVLVQPSFLGTDNSCLLRALAGNQGRLKGVAVVSPDVSREALLNMSMAGVAGIRLNLVQQAYPDLGNPSYANLWRWLGDLGYHVELHREAADIAPLIQLLLDTGLPVVVDHFGRPDPQQGTNDPGFKSLLRFGPSGRVWVKVSGAYRCAARGSNFIYDATAQLLDAFGPEHLMWGSDWPHTQFEQVANYSDTLSNLLDLNLNKAILDAMLCSTAQSFYRFAKEPTGKKTLTTSIS
ncbi:amidohydrolase family protein [Paraburkholderia sp. GAS42]|jgi:predicted TIM-barrel fold metal-dependent hydrolase|uniref:amidohydrolase family protein n=1 Tax=Paraburkholderia sp. GAS42 TaxID=3035135 RepID=UPI003D1B0E86